MARIMIVDDSTVMRLNLKRILTDVGHTIVGEAQNGKEACSLYEKLKPDLVTMDISMPVMTGVEATKAIVAKFPDANIIMISALNQKKMVYDALKNGARHYIIKPIDKDKVISVLSEVLLKEAAETVGPEVLSPEPKEGFEIENKEGVFHIRLFETFNSEDMTKLNMTLQGIKFIKPLKIKFDFGTVRKMESVYLNELISYGSEVIQLGGEYESYAEDENLRRLIEMKEENYLK